MRHRILPAGPNCLPVCLLCGVVVFPHCLQQAAQIIVRLCIVRVQSRSLPVRLLCSGIGVPA